MQRVTEISNKFRLLCEFRVTNWQRVRKQCSSLLHGVNVDAVVASELNDTLCMLHTKAK